VSESVKLAKARRLPPALSAFVNAVGRTLATEIHNLSFPSPESEPTEALAAAASLPYWLAARWLADLGREAAWARGQASNLHPPLTIRVNTALMSRETLRGVLQNEGLETEPCPYSSVGLNLQAMNQPPFGLPSYQRGLWLFQDEAAQLVTLLLEARPGQCILEIGAGRGGKTTYLSQILQGQGRILAVDYSQARLGALRRNLERMALTGVDLLLTNALTSLPIRSDHRFDRILIDAPCSGLGVLRRHPELRWRRQPDDFARFAARQQAMLRQAAFYLRPGGLILYITCTTEAEENEQVVQDFLDRQPAFCQHRSVAALPSPAQHFIDSQSYFRTLPERDGLDGFFAAALMKKE
jgi:16S rRNA (cytosine967-C5)-methyltransferase